MIYNYTSIWDATMHEHFLHHIQMCVMGRIFTVHSRKFFSLVRYYIDRIIRPILFAYANHWYTPHTPTFSSANPSDLVQN